MKRLVVASLFVLAATAIVYAQEKANPSGVWKWMQPTFGENTSEATAKIKVDGDKVSGTVSIPFGQAKEARESQIENGKYKDGDISFSTSFEFKAGGTKRTTKYSGKVSGDTIKGNIERETKDGNQKSDWVAKREVEKKK